MCAVISKGVCMSDVINERVDSAMAEIEVRAQKLKKIKEMARAKNMLKDPGNFRWYRNCR